jgi:signal transduction histidine kinase
VEIAPTPSEITLRVSDAGDGFDPLTSQAAGLGLLTMRERIELVGGAFRIDTAPEGGGTMVEAIVPLTSGRVKEGNDESRPPSLSVRSTRRGYSDQKAG